MIRIHEEVGVGSLGTKMSQPGTNWANVITGGLRLSPASQQTVPQGCIEIKPPEHKVVIPPEYQAMMDEINAHGKSSPKWTDKSAMAKWQAEDRAIRVKYPTANDAYQQATVEANARFKKEFEDLQNEYKSKGYTIKTVTEPYGLRPAYAPGMKGLSPSNFGQWAGIFNQLTSYGRPAGRTVTYACPAGAEAASVLEIGGGSKSTLWMIIGAAVLVLGGAGYFAYRKMTKRPQ